MLCENRGRDFAGANIVWQRDKLPYAAGSGAEGVAVISLNNAVALSEWENRYALRPFGALES